MSVLNCNVGKRLINGNISFETLAVLLVGFRVIDQKEEILQWSVTELNSISFALNHVFNNHAKSGCSL